MPNPTLNSRLIHAYNFQNPAIALDFSLKSLEECLQHGLIVLDANVLLLPLTTGKLTLEAIRDVLQQLIVEDRLYIPNHALREYLANRPTKIKELIDQLNKKRDKDYSSASSPLLQQAKISDSLDKAETALREKAQELSKIISEAIEEVKGWKTNDPVSRMYTEIKLSDRLLPDPIDLQSEKEISEFIAEHEERIKNKVPPGFKDSRKEDNDVGDFLIWKSILKLGEKYKGKDVTFISGEIKTDWIYRSANQSMHAREELIEEYRNYSEGGSFHLIDFATLLKELKQNTSVVEEVRSSEVTTSYITKIEDAELEFNSLPANWQEFLTQSHISVGTWLRNFYTPNKITTHPPGSIIDYTVQDEHEIALIEVKGIRHVEHVSKRIKEFEKYAAPLIDSAFPLSEKNVISVIIFVCENKEKAEYINGWKKNNALPTGVNVVAGYLEKGVFQTSI